MSNLLKLFDSPPNETPYDSKRYKAFYPSDRYFFDNKLIFKPIEKGWKQWDTQQDASYYGIWINPIRFQILQYAEGDVYFEIFKNKEAFDEEIERMAAYHGDPPPWAVSYDDKGQKTVYYDKRYGQSNNDFDALLERKRS